MIPLLDSSKSVQDNYDALWTRYVAENERATLLRDLLDALTVGTFLALEAWADKYSVKLSEKGARRTLYMNAENEAIQAAIRKAKGEL